MVRSIPRSLLSMAELAMPMKVLGRFREPDSFSFEEFSLGVLQPSGPITIDKTQVLNLGDKILVFEFEVPFDGFMLPDKNTEIHVHFDDSPDVYEARILKRESSKTGPHRAGLIVRLALRWDCRQCRRHQEARIHWDGGIRRGLKKSRIQVELNLLLKSDM
jgi:hypothetical protein